MDRDRLARWFQRFAELEVPTLPLYQRLCVEAARDAALLDQVLTAAPGQWRPNILLAALHDLVLRYPDEPLAAWYPTVGGDPEREGDLMGAVHAMFDAHEAEFSELVTTRATQTNEANRSMLMLPALGAVLEGIATPDELARRGVVWVEIGASAGLNLAFDSFALDYDRLGLVAGDPASPVRCRTEARGDLDAARRHVSLAERVDVVARIGVDLIPVNLEDPAERRWLKACVWPEQLERHERLDAAIDVVAPLRRNGTLDVERDDAVDGLAEAIDTVVERAAEAGFSDPIVVVLNTWVMTYLRKERRAAFDRTLDLAGMDHTLIHLSAEGDGVEGWVPTETEPSTDTVVGASRWIDGDRFDARITTCHPHLAWLLWPTEIAWRRRT